MTKSARWQINNLINAGMLVVSNGGNRSPFSTIKWSPLLHSEETQQRIAARSSHRILNACPGMMDN